jgi:uncharacterized damage-inducible protein DinB
MTLTEVSCKVLEQLAGLTRQVAPGDFVRPSAALNQSTIGQHLRHTLEFFLCLEKGVPDRVVNYDLRDHDELMQSDKEFALLVLERIADFLKSQLDNPALQLQVSYDRTGETWITVESNYQRELIYNIEHAVHHMAIMKIGLREVAPYVRIPDDFGIAVSTLRQKEAAISAR